MGYTGRYGRGKTAIIKPYGFRFALSGFLFALVHNEFMPIVTLPLRPCVISFYGFVNILCRYQCLFHAGHNVVISWFVNNRQTGRKLVECVTRTKQRRGNKNVINQLMKISDNWDKIVGSLDYAYKKFN